VFEALYNERIETMKSKLEIYALSVCFVSVFCLVISLGLGSYALVEISAPELTMSSYNYDQFQSNEAYWSKNTPYCGKGCEAVVKPGKDELAKQRIEAFKIAKKSEARSGFQSLIKCSLFILLSTLALLIHFKIAKKSRE